MRPRETTKPQTTGAMSREWRTQLDLRLPEKLPVDKACLAGGLKAKLLIEGAGQFVITAGDRLTQPEGVFG